MAIRKPRPLCACGCGETVRLSRHRYVLYHAARVQPTGPSAYRWNGGETRNKGYVLVFKPNHQRAVGGYVRRSLLVAEQKLGRTLNDGEVVHHLNQQRDDDRPENIEVLPSQSNHIALHNRNIKRGRKLTESQVREIKQLVAPHPKPPWPDLDPRSVRAVAERFGVNTGTINSIKRGDYWRWVTA